MHAWLAKHDSVNVI